MNDKKRGKKSVIIPVKRHDGTNPFGEDSSRGGVVVTDTNAPPARRVPADPPPKKR